MDFEWTIADNFPVIADRISAASRFGTYAEAPIPDQDLVDAGCRTLLRSEQFTNKFTEWIARPQNMKTWAHFKDFWPEKVSLKQQTANAARNFGFGGAAVDEEIQQGINDFASAHAQTIATINGLQQQNAQLAQMLQQSQQQMAAMQVQVAAMATNTAQQRNNWNNYGGRRGRGG